MTKIRGNKNYELSNHLGNVLAVVSDMKVGFDGNGDSQADYYSGVVKSANDYYPFGWGQYNRIYNSPAYRYGFNGKEKDENGEFGSQTVYDYGFRIYNPAIAKFLSVDPLTYSYPELTPYQFASNTPIWAADLDGLEAEYRNDGSIWYKVMKGQGFTQIVDDLGVSGTLITWTNLRDQNPETACHISGCERDDPGNKQYKENTRLNEGDYLYVGFYDVAEPAVEVSEPDPASTPASVGVINDGVGGLGAAFVNDQGRYGFSKRAKGVKSLLPTRYYGNGWGGNKYFKTASPNALGSVLNRVSWAGNLAIGAYNINEANKLDGRTFGINTKRASITTATSITGALVGAEAGMATGGAIGAFFGGIGAAPGAIVGGLTGSILGGIGGGELGEKVSDEVLEEKKAGSNE